MPSQREKITFLSSDNKPHESVCLRLRILNFFELTHSDQKSVKVSFESSGYAIYSLTHKNRKYNPKKLTPENVYGVSLEFIHKSRTKGYVHNSTRSRLLNCAIVPVF